MDWRAILSNKSNLLLGIKLGKSVKTVKNMLKATNFFRAKVRFAIKKRANHPCHSLLKSKLPSPLFCKDRWKGLGHSFSILKSHKSESLKVALFKESDFERKREERKSEFPTLVISGSLQNSWQYCTVNTVYALWSGGPILHFTGFIFSLLTDPLMRLLMLITTDRLNVLLTRTALLLVRIDSILFERHTAFN